MEELLGVCSTESRMTVYRSLSRLAYLTSYSHRGGCYSLPEIVQFDELGLWDFQSVMFSQFGNLVETAAQFVGFSDAGYVACELDLVLKVECKHALLNLLRSGRIAREQIQGRFVFLSADPAKRRQQTLMRQQMENQPSVVFGADADVGTDELRAAIILFFSLLDEKKRRLFAGLEASRMGHGGDRKISQLLGLDPHTVAKGRHELFSGSVDRGATRKKGGGKKLVEKKRQK